MRPAAPYNVPDPPKAGGRPKPIKPINRSHHRVNHVLYYHMKLTDGDAYQTCIALTINCVCNDLASQPCTTMTMTPICDFSRLASCRCQRGSRVTRSVPCTLLCPAPWDPPSSARCWTYKHPPRRHPYLGARQRQGNTALPKKHAPRPPVWSRRIPDVEKLTDKEAPEPLRERVSQNRLGRLGAA